MFESLAVAFSFLSKSRKGLGLTLMLLGRGSSSGLDWELETVNGFVPGEKTGRRDAALQAINACPSVEVKK